VRTEAETLNIGLLLCHRKNDALVELTLPENSSVYASRYELYLPSKEALTSAIDDSGQSLSEIAVSTIMSPEGFSGDRGTSLRCARRKT
jgi:hypothetical protein